LYNLFFDRPLGLDKILCKHAWLGTIQARESIAGKPFSRLAILDGGSLDKAAYIVLGYALKTLADSALDNRLLSVSG
jgi:hypothetical protein